MQHYGPGHAPAEQLGTEKREVKGNGSIAGYAACLLAI